MVSYADILNNNTSLSTAGSGLTAVFVGATNGIGLGALLALTKHTDSPTIFIVGRSVSALQSLITDTLTPLNRSATFHPIHAADLALISSAQSAANQIAQLTQKIDLLFLSPGYISLAYTPTAESLDRVTALRYYSRMRFAVTLAPQLRAAPSPRIVSVLAGGKEGALWPDDWTLQHHYGLAAAGGASSSMTTLFFEEFAKQPGNERLVCVHLYPGLVGGTGLRIEGLPGWANVLMDWVVAPLFRMVGYTKEEAGERVVFAATSGRFRRLSGDGGSAEGTLVQKGSNGRVGSGVYLVQGDSSVVVGGKVLEGLRAEGMGPRLMDHTMGVYEAVEATAK